ncbi:hypothetical protein JCM3766R1_002006 [Sporobolomyces carnicolor]
MSYADAAHHAPTTSDPVPDQSLLVSDQDAAPNPDAKHVRVATDTDTDAGTGQDAAGKSGQGEQSPRQASSKVNDPSAAKPGSNGSELATSNVKKSKKGKKNKKKTATPPSDDHPQQSHDDEQQSSQPQATASKEEETQQQHQKPQGEKSASTGSSVGEEAATEGGHAPSQPAHETDRDEIHNRAEAADEGKGEEHGQASEPGGKGFKTQLESLSSTSDRPTVSKDLDQKLVDPYVPRANIAATVEHPDGTTENDYAKVHKDESVLQQHVAFFDRDHDGIIWPSDTLVGFHKLGYSLIWCIMAVFLIHPTFSFFTLSSWIPDPFFRIRVKSIHRARHGSDTGVYDSQGRFVSAKFEEIFEKFDTEKKGGLTFIEGLKMIQENRNVLDPIGWIGAFFEWFASYLLIWPRDGIVTKEDLRTIYDGSIFFAIAEKESTVRKRQHRFYSGLFKENRSGDINKFHRKIQ